MEKIKFTPSAARHGITEETVRYIIRNPIEAGPIADREGFPAVKLKGTLHAQTDRVAEVFISLKGNTFLVFHAMETGERYT